MGRGDLSQSRYCLVTQRSFQGRIYRIYSIERLDVYQIFSVFNAAFIQEWRLIKGGKSFVNIM